MPAEKKAKTLLLAIFLALTPHLRAADDEKENAANYPELSKQRIFIEKNISISEWIDRRAEDIDGYFVEENLTDKKNLSELRFENLTYAPSGGPTKNWLSANVNLRLPRVEEYWNLKFTSYDETKENRAAQRANPELNRESDLGASVGLFRNFGKIRATFRPRIALTNPLRVGHALTFETDSYREGYILSPKFQFFAKPDDGTGVFASFYVLYQLPSGYSVTLINDGEYFSKSHLLAVSNGISLTQALSERHSFSYTFICDSNNNENYHLDAYTASVGWYHEIYKNILSYQIIPSLSFAKVNSFIGRPATTFRFLLTF